MNRKLKRDGLIKLLALAIISAVAWRVELEWRGGWASLTWITYFHWAIPFCGLVFIAWIVSVTRVKLPQMMAAVLVGFFSIAFVFFDWVSGFCFNRWIVLPGLMQWTFWSIPFFWVLIPVGLGLISRAFGVELSWRKIALSAVLFVISWPLSIFILELVGHRGGADLIHALKSGFVIPLLIIALGFPLLPSVSRD